MGAALACALAAGVQAQAPSSNGVPSPALPEKVDWWLDSDLLKVPLPRPPRGSTRVELRPSRGDERRALASAGECGPNDIDGLYLVDLDRDGSEEAFGCIGTNGFSGYCFVGRSGEEGWELTKTDVDYPLGQTGARTVAFDFLEGRYLMVVGVAQPTPGRFVTQVQTVRYDGSTFVTETAYRGR